MNYRLTGGLLRLVKNQFQEFFPYYIGAFICLFLTHKIQSLLPFYAKELAQLVTVKSDSIDLKKFFYLAIGIVVFRSSSRLLFFYPARVLQNHLRLELLSRLEKCLPLRYEKFSSGNLYQILGGAMDDIRALIGFALLQVGNIIIALAVLLPKLMEFNPDLLIALLPLLFGFIIFSLIIRTNAVTFKKGQETQAKVQHFIMESYQGKETIKNYFSEQSFLEQFSKISLKELFYFYVAGKKVAISLPLIPLGLGLSMIWGSYIIHIQNLDASGLIVFIGFIYLLSEPMMYLAWIGVVFARSSGAWSRIKDLLKKVETPTDLEQSLLEMNPAINDFAFNTVFWDEKLKLALRKKEWNVFVSKTGHGKSEILGQIANIFVLRGKKVSFVTQSPYLYDDTLFSNIVLGRTVTDKLSENVYALLKLFELDFLAKDKKDLFELKVGENGKRLSGGQIKRICLIRSLVSESDVLIWDDPFSSVDLIIEKQIIEKLQKDSEYLNKTFLLSSHRLSTVRACSHYLLLEKKIGVVEEGHVFEAMQKKSLLFSHFKEQQNAVG